MKNRDSDAIARRKQVVEENAAKLRSELGDTVVPSDLSSEEEENLRKHTRGKRGKAQTPAAAPPIEIYESSDAEEEEAKEANKRRNVKAATQPRRNQGKRSRGRVSTVEGQSLPPEIEDDRTGVDIDGLRRAAAEKAQVELENARLHQQLLQMQEETERLKNPPSREIALVTNQAENSK
jgi:hypothetical protein